MKYIMLLFVLISFAYSQEAQTVTIITTDGSEIIGKIIEESDIEYTIETPAGLTVTIPKSAVFKMTEFEGLVKEGKLYRADPNKSMYLFAPSAFPIEKGNKYCRDFCVFFPSLNYGVNDIVSLQAGFIWVPEIKLDQIPLVGSIKATVFQKDKISLAGGAMYVRIPDFEESGGGGFLFATGTYGDRFNHGSLLIGWGYGHYDGDWELMDRPIVVLAGNFRVSNTIAIVTENWFPPDLELGQFPFMVAGRFFGKRIAVDIGGIIILDLIKEGGLPIPLINFTYHF
ncbi:MAG: hypothetical protein GWP19_10710 [Planctomycetia bacterium]|nr:hypothetical protein [Planctomycetia bacterium]